MLVTSLLALFAIADGTYTNPVYAHNFPDPFVFAYMGQFYAYATQNGGKGFQVMTSTDLVNWTPKPPINTPSWSKRNLWAPEMYQRDGKFYLFYSALNMTTKKRDLAVSVGDSPLGPFKDYALLVPGLPENPTSTPDGAIDGTVYYDGDQPYLLYIREAPPRALKIAKLAKDFSKLEGEAKDLLHPDRPIEQGILDAPTLIKRGNTYYLFFSGGWFQSDKKDSAYRVWVATSKSLMGPYKKAAKPVLEGNAETLSPGHQTIFKLPSGEWWMAYHGWDASGDPKYGSNKLGRTLRIDKLTWTKDGPKMDGPSLTPQPAPKINE